MFFLHFLAVTSPLPLPHVVLLAFAKDRPHFSFPVESYSQWIVLGATRGRFSYALDDGPEEVCQSGEFLICPPGISLRRTALETLNFYVIGFRWKNDLAPTWQGKHALTDLVRMNSTLSALEDSLLHPGEAGESVWVNHLLSDLFHQRLHERAAAQPGKTPDRLMVQVAEELRRDMSNPVNLEEIARSLRLTPSQFSRRFAATMGINPGAYRTKLRLQESRRLLLETSLSIEGIANACGFESAFYFSRIFAKQAGQPPSVFRKTRQV